jgi:hypothetical protein
VIVFVGVLFPWGNFGSFEVFLDLPWIKIVTRHRFERLIFNVAFGFGLIGQINSRSDEDP